MREELIDLSNLRLISAQELEQVIRRYENNEHSIIADEDYHYFLDDVLWTVRFSDRSLSFQKEHFYIEAGVLFSDGKEAYQNIASVVIRDGMVSLERGFSADAILLYGSDFSVLPEDGYFLFRDEQEQEEEGCILSGNVRWAINAFAEGCHATEKEIWLAKGIADRYHMTCGCEESCLMEDGCALLKRISRLPMLLPSRYTATWVKMAVEQCCNWLSGTSVMASVNY